MSSHAMQNAIRWELFPREKHECVRPAQHLQGLSTNHASAGRSDPAVFSVAAGHAVREMCGASHMHGSDFAPFFTGVAVCPGRIPAGRHGHKDYEDLEQLLQIDPIPPLCRLVGTAFGDADSTSSILLQLTKARFTSAVGPSESLGARLVFRDPFILGKTIILCFT